MAAVFIFTDCAHLLMTSSICFIYISFKLLEILSCSKVCVTVMLSAIFVIFASWEFPQCHLRLGNSRTVGSSVCLKRDRLVYM